MYVLNQMEDTVWLRATAYNRCQPEGVSRRYWFVCSFYGVDEQQANAVVYPNPTSGLITVEADNMERVRVVNMLGQVMEETAVDHADKMTLNLADLPASVYLLEIKTKEGLVKRRIVLSR